MKKMKFPEKNLPATGLLCRLGKRNTNNGVHKKDATESFDAC